MLEFNLNVEEVFPVVQTRIFTFSRVGVFVFYLTAAVCCLARQGCVTGREGGGVVVAEGRGGGVYERFGPCCREIVEG